MASTLFLMPDTWDLTLDNNGNIAIATSTYQQAQDICSACRTMVKDMYYSQTEGIPYLEKILGMKTYSLALYRQQLYDACMSVDGVTSATVNLQLKDRVLSGTIQFKNTQDETVTINL